ncbi:MAG: hypothetical protein ACRD63_14705 [Pyrinomonadaceae bacterium]
MTFILNVLHTGFSIFAGDKRAGKSGSATILGQATSDRNAKVRAVSYGPMLVIVMVYLGAVVIAGLRPGTGARIAQSCEDTKTTS